MTFSAERDRGGSSTQTSVVAGRYQLLRELGGGGMAVVYEVVDAQRGKVAFKRPRQPDSPDQAARLYELFAREFQVLSQLAHPRIVQVYDYGVDEAGPYYTMELLDGGDLQQGVPSDHMRVCAAARDICSALSLLHSRRMVHRDISPRNVRCTADGTAKLIDFGAMTMMGPAKELVGTPVCCAPEMLNRQELDGRTDLYALGATMYYVLTGRHAYPVREFANLSNAWSFGFPRPSELVPAIPAALDALVLDLLQLDPNDRPRSAAEVMERLAVIEGKPLDEHLLVAQAYLSSPAFVGREGELLQIRERLLHKRGGAVLIHGAAGVGRTRLLDASVLAAKLLGVTPLRADADDASREYGVAGALLTQLFRLAPELARQSAGEDLPLLASLAPELAGPGPAPLSAASAEVQAALRKLFLEFSRHAPLAIGIDDFERIDEPSTALLALLARDARKARVTLVATIESNALASAGTTQRLFADAAQQLDLGNLSLPATHSILASVFGESPELEPLVQRLFAIAQGNPRDLMRIAQHLVDQRVVRYQAGAWVLPARFESVELPSSVSEILNDRVAQLGPSARSLARVWALCPEQSLSEADCAVLEDGAEPAQLMRDLEQLVQADIAVKIGERYRFRDRAWVSTLLADLSPVEAPQMQRRVARMFEHRGGEGFRVGQHLLRAGERERALDHFVAHAIASRAATDKSPEEFYTLVRSLPADWQDTYEEVLQLCQELERPRRDWYAVLDRLSGLNAVASQYDTPHLANLTVDLRKASGLDDWAALDPSMPPEQRLREAIQLAQARFVATPEHERWLDPGSAVRALTRAVSDSVGQAVRALDLRALRALPSLEPFVPLGPMVAIVQQMAEGVRARLSGRMDRTREIYQAVIERSSVKENAALGETHRRAVQMGVTSALSMTEAAMGLACSLEGARTLEAESLYRANALLIRMLYELFQGNVLEADRHRRKIDVLRLESGARQAGEHWHLLWQAVAFAAMEDLTRLKRVVEELDGRVASQSVGWQHVGTYASAEYQRVRGDLSAAELTLSTQLAELQVGDHQLWAYAAGARVQTLQELGRLDEAVSAGRRYLAQAEDAQLGFGASFVRLPLAVAEARLGVADAAQHADHVIRRFLELEVSGLNLGLAYEARARVALEQADQTAYDEYSLRCSQEYMRAGNPALSARYQRLRRAAQHKSLVTVPPRADAPADAPDNSRWKERLVTCQSRAERARATLSVLAEQTGASQGFLYHVSTEGPVLVAAVGRHSKPPEGLNGMVRDYIAAESDEDLATAPETAETTLRTDWTVQNEALYRPVLLSHYVDDGFAITGLAVFALGPEQQFAYPRDIAIQLSQLAADMGDVTSLVVSDG